MPQSMSLAVAGTDAISTTLPAWALHGTSPGQVPKSVAPRKPSAPTSSVARGLPDPIYVCSVPQTVLAVLPGKHGDKVGDNTKHLCSVSSLDGHEVVGNVAGSTKIGRGARDQIKWQCFCKLYFATRDFPQRFDSRFTTGTGGVTGATGLEA